MKLTMILLSIDMLLFGLVPGLAVALLVYVREYFKRRVLQQEIKSLRKHLHQKLEIDASSIDQRLQEIERLKKENENLRITNQAMAQKPGRSELMNYYIYQKAIAFMAEAAPGFAPLWQRALKDAEAEMAEIEAGKKPFLKRVIQLPASWLRALDGPTQNTDV